MKKTLAALAVLGAFAGSAAAADVTLYGIVDYGFLYKHSESTAADTGNTTKTDSLTLDSGVDSASRFGLKGTEDLGNGMKVGFKLENGFSADDGTLSQNGRLFGREASLSLYTDFGTFSFGRMGSLGSAAGTYDTVFLIGDAFDGGDGDVFGFATTDRYDNMVAYQSPKFAGLQVTAMYSFKEDTTKNVADGVDNTDYGAEGDFSSANRYAGVALTGEYGPAQFVAAYELLKYGYDPRSGQNHDRALEDKDGNIFYLGGNYDFGVTRVFAMGQYFDGLTSHGLVDKSPAVDSDGVKGYGLHLGTQTPISNGLLTVGAYYVDYEQDGVLANAQKEEGTYYGLAARYEYDLSKRTMLYVGAGYGQDSRDRLATDRDDEESQVTQAYVGLTHRF